MARPRMGNCRWYFRQTTCWIYLLILGALLLFVYNYYQIGPQSIFSSKKEEVSDGRTISKEEEEVKSMHESNVDAQANHVVEDKDARHTENHGGSGGFINVIITFTNAGSNSKLQTKFTLCVSSMMRLATVPLAFHIIGDVESQNLAEDIIKKNSGRAMYKIVHLDMDDLAHRLHEVVSRMQKHFSYKPGAYYSQALFFLSIAIHRVMPETMMRVIMLDADLKFQSDIAQLYALFDNFKDSNVMGIARENQPVYHHLLWQYRREHPDTRVGKPPPDGLTGFNSGVLLLDLERMRKSSLYNSLVTDEAVDRLTEAFHFKGHLGDQDFFTLLSFAHEELFYVLPCGWNRQLCQWWRGKGYDDIYDQYYTCEGPVHIYHGNCDTPIP